MTVIMPNHSGKIGLVIGANRGIGLEVVHQLAQLGMTVLLGSRDAEKGEPAAKPFVDEGLNVMRCKRRNRAVKFLADVEA